jgi:hypothetical protein
MQNSNKIRYFTKNTTLASWLHMNGLQYDGITDDISAQMIFLGTQEEIDNLINEFNNGNPRGNIITFFRSYKYLLSQIKER